MYSEPIWVRKQKALDPEARAPLKVIAETIADGSVLLYAEPYAGVCVAAARVEDALMSIEKNANAYRSWSEGKPIEDRYKPTVSETYRSQASDVFDSRVIFDCERRPFPAKTHARMHREAVQSALCLTQMLNALPDADATQGGLSGRARLRELNKKHEAFAAALGTSFTVTGDFYADRAALLRTLEYHGFMRNPVRTADGEDFSYRKVLRRLILTDRLYARWLYAYAVSLWGASTDPFGVRDETTQSIKL